MGLKCGLMADGREHDVGQFYKDLPSDFIFCLEWTVSVFAEEHVQLFLYACEASFDKCLLE